MNRVSIIFHFASTKPRCQNGTLSSLLHPLFTKNLFSCLLTLRALCRKEQERRDASRRRVAALVIGPAGKQRCDEDVAAMQLTASRMSLKALQSFLLTQTKDMRTYR